MISHFLELSLSLVSLLVVLSLAMLLEAAILISAIFTTNLASAVTFCQDIIIGFLPFELSVLERETHP